MSADAAHGGRPVEEQAGEKGTYSVDAHEAMGVQIGENNTQIIYSYNKLTWTDGVAPPPLVGVSGTVDSPYRGLSAFDEQDAAFFFGRETAATEVLERMSQHLNGSGLLMVSGVSGAGKSSLLQAGVLPRMRGAGLAAAPWSAHWPCLLFTPTRAPLDELAVRVASLAGVDAATVRRGLTADPSGFALTARQAAEGRSGALTEEPDHPEPVWRHRRLLLVVDQFEQLFTQCAAEEQRRAFITALHTAATTRNGPDDAPAALVIVGVRADFEARCADYPQLSDAVQNRYLVSSMTERQLRMAITEPAKKAGFQVEGDLVDVLLAEVRTRRSGTSGAGMLPLLSHALDQAWRSRIGDVLTLADYERTGGIEGAVAESAQRAYDRLTRAEQAAARQVFTRLTATTSDGVDTADRATRAELTEGKSAADARDVEAALETFAAKRLLTLAVGTVEISHEVLLTAWPLLRDTWLAETHADRIVRTRLHNVAVDWAGDSRDPSYLYSGSLLEAARETAARIGADPGRHPPLSQTERDFLRASDRARHRSLRRRQSFTAVLMALVIGFASFAVLALLARQDSVHQLHLAVSRQLINESETLGDTNPAISKLESIAAWRINPSIDARYAMLAAAARPGIAVLTGHTARVNSVAFSPDGKILASGSTDGTVRLWDVARRVSLGILRNQVHVKFVSSINSVAFSPDGKILASGNNDGTVLLWNVATRHQSGPLLGGHDSSVFSVAFSPDGKTLASGTYNGRVWLWNVATRQQIKTPLTEHSAVNSLAFSPNGETLATGNADKTVRLWNVPDRTETILTGHTDEVQSVAFSRDGKTLASGSLDGTVRLWNMATRQQIGNPLTAHTGEITSVVFSRDGTTLAVGGGDNTVRLWDIGERTSIAVMVGHTSTVWSLAFSPDGKTLASGSQDHTVRLWDVASLTDIGVLVGHFDAVGSVAFSPDGKTLASGSDDDTVRLWNVVNGEQILNPLTGHTGAVNSVAFSPDGKTLASGSDDATVRLWDIATHRQIGIFSLGRFNAIESLAFSPNGKILASASDDNTVRLWNVATHQQIGNSLSSGLDAIESMTFSPDGKALATGNFEGDVRLWNVATHQQIGNALSSGTGAVNSVAFSPDGKTLASASDDQAVRLWNIASRTETGTLIGNAGPVYSVAFSPDGKTLASGSEDDTVRLWDLATREQIGNPLTGHADAVNSVAFSPDGKTLGSGSDDDTVRLWNVAYLVDTVPHLCDSAGRSLTRTEWKRYIPEFAYERLCS
jgi:WD40 repeat protein